MLEYNAIYSADGAMQKILKLFMLEYNFSIKGQKMKWRFILLRLFSQRN